LGERPLFVLLLTLTLVTACVACENQPVVWQVGVPDGSYAEFSGAGRYEDYANEHPGGATTEIGKGDPAKGWIYVQPGPDSGSWAGEGDHPYEVVFVMPGKPTALYALQVDLVDVSPASETSLTIRVNDRTEDHVLQRGRSVASLTDPEQGRPQSIKVYVPGGFLNEGRNVFNIRVSKGGWVTYDALTFYECTTEQPPKPIRHLSVSSTNLFKSSKTGLKQIVTASMELFQGQSQITAEIHGRKCLIARQVFRNVANGLVKLEIETPVIKTRESVDIRIIINDRACEAEGVLEPRRMWTLYLVPLAHYDHGYTHVQSETLAIHRENADRAMDWFAKYPGFVWNSENSMLVDDYLANGGRRDELVQWARTGRLGIQALYANPLSGLCSGEELSCYLDYYDSLRRQYGIDSSAAIQDDVPTMAGTVPMVLKGHGVKYFMHRVNTIRGPFGELFRHSPFYWESPDGSKVLSWVTADQTYGMEMTDAGTVERMGQVVDEFLQPYEQRTDYPYDAILVFGAYLDNDRNREALASVPEQWNHKYAYPKVVLSRGTEFFEHIERKYAGKPGTFKGDGGVYWEDGAASSARETGITRVAKEQLTSAEKLTSLCGAEFASQERDELAAAWRQVMLYDEHTWGAGGSVSDPSGEATLEQWAVKQSFADNAGRMGRELLDRALDRFCNSLNAPQGSVVVFNPSSWPRSETVVWDLDGRKLSLFAGDVPPLGYRVFSSADAHTCDAQAADSVTLENSFYRIRFDESTGAVVSILDKELQRELVDRSQYGLNAYLYAAGGEYSQAINFTGMELVNLAIQSTTGAKLDKSVGVDGQTMEITSVAPKARSFACRVVLHDRRKRIDFINEMDKEATTDKEAAYFAFPFAFNNPSVRIEIPSGVVRPEVDQLPGACRSWYAAQQFVIVSDASAAVVFSPIDSPLITLQDINRETWPQHIEVKNGWVFAYVMNNYWFTNYKAAQGGPLTFRFAITSGPGIGDVQAKRFGEEVQSPLLARIVARAPDSPGESSRAFVRAGSENVVVQAVKPARFTDGVIVRLREMGGKSVKTQIKVEGIGFKHAFLCNLAEDKEQELNTRGGVIEVPCPALGLATILLER
jgi:alpha-mannosidase